MVSWGPPGSPRVHSQKVQGVTPSLQRVIPGQGNLEQQQQAAAAAPPNLAAAARVRMAWVGSLAAAKTRCISLVMWTFACLDGFLLDRHVLKVRGKHKLWAHGGPRTQPHSARRSRVRSGTRVQSMAS